MKAAAKPELDDNHFIYMLPRWVTSARGQDTDSVAFSSGAALTMLDVVLRDPDGTLPGALLRDRLALQAAVECLKLEGRSETASAVRDSVCLARAGEALGPAGEMFVAWRRLARIRLAGSSWRSQIKKLLPGPVAEMMSMPQGGAPVVQAAQVLADVLREFPREEAAALMLADATLARAVGWDRTVPLLAAHMARKDIRMIADGEGDPTLCVHHAMIAASDAAIRRAADLTRRSVKLQAIAPKLRAKGSDEALALFLSHDAVSPSGMLSRGSQPSKGTLPPMIQGTSFAMSGRAARRLCDRLVDLGVVRELTGRPTFRLYGV